MPFFDTAIKYVNAAFAKRDERINKKIFCQIRKTLQYLVQQDQ